MTGTRADVSMAERLLSVLIVSWNTRDHLERCLQQLMTDAKPARAEVIVVDNASTDGSAEMVEQRFPEIHLERNTENVGFAAGVNQAARAARGDVLLFLNSDTVLEPNTIPVCLEYLLDNDDVAVVGCRLRFPDGRTQSSTFRFPSLRGILLTALRISQAFPNSWYLNWDRYGHRAWPEPQDVDVTMGSFLLLRRSALRTEDPLDEGYFMYGEESDMCRDLLERGWRTVHLPTARLVHVHGGSTKTPELEGWATEAKSRGILRFLWKWRASGVAWTANLIMMLGMGPRALGWGLLDLVDGLRRGRVRMERLHKARSLRLHLVAFFKPGVLQQRWSGPDAIRTDHE